MSPDAGYSGTPLPKKLGIAAGSSVLLVDAPAGFVLEPLPDGVTFGGGGPYDVIVLFCTDLADLATGFDAARAELTDAGGLWVAWPKRSSGVPTDLSDNVV